MQIDRHSISEIAVQLQHRRARSSRRAGHSISEIAVQLQLLDPFMGSGTSHSISEIAVQLQQPSVVPNQ